MIASDEQTLGFSPVSNTAVATKTEATTFLDIGAAKLIPLPRDEWSNEPTDAQKETWELIQLLAIAVDGKITELGLANLLGLKSIQPMRCRIQRLVENNALIVA